MTIPNPKGNPESLKSFTRLDFGEKLADKPIMIRLEQSVYDFVQAMPPKDKSAWLRKVIKEAAKNTLINLLLITVICG